MSLVPDVCEQCGLPLWDADDLQPGGLVCVCDDPDALEPDEELIPLASFTHTVTAEKVTAKAVKLVACSRCRQGRKLRRTKTMTEPLRPTDRPLSIVAFMRVEAEEWTPVAEHPPCQCPYFADAS